MENKTSFDLNQHIQNWSEQLGQSPALQRENLQELEAHLRDSIALLQMRGLSAEEAFLVAVKRAGTSESLAVEFGKVNRQPVWVDRLLWMLIGLQLWGMVRSFINGIARMASSLAMVNLEDINRAYGAFIPAVVLAVIQVLALVGSLAICWWLIIRKGQYFETWMGSFFKERVSRAAQGSLFILILTGILLPYFVNMLVIRIFETHIYLHRTFENAYSKNYYNIFMGFCQVAILMMLTIVLARKRLNSSPAA